jgi:hypothetical protein
MVRGISRVYRGESPEASGSEQDNIVTKRTPSGTT